MLSIPVREPKGTGNMPKVPMIPQNLRNGIHVDDIFNEKGVLIVTC